MSTTNLVLKIALSLILNGTNLGTIEAAAPFSFIAPQVNVPQPVNNTTVTNDPGIPQPPTNGFFISTTGNSINHGTINEPWPLQFALNGANGQIVPGSTNWIRGGVYSGNFVNTWSGGGSNNPVTYRAYPGETVIFRGVNTTGTLDPVGSQYNYTYPGGDVLMIQQSLQPNGGGRGVAFWGIIFEQPVALSAIDSPAAGAVNIIGNSSNTFLINCTIRNCGMGLKIFSDRAGYFTSYGTMIYYTGFGPTVSTKNHHIYVQNKGIGTYAFEENLFWGGGEIQAIVSTGGDDRLHDTGFSGCAWWNSEERHTQFGFGGGNNRSNYWRYCYAYYPTNTLVPGTDLAYSQNNYDFLPAGHIREYATNNYFVGGQPVIGLGQWQSGTFSNNTIISHAFSDGGGGNPWIMWFKPYKGLWSWPGLVVNHNTYYGPGGNARFVGADGQSLTFGNWKAVTGFDANSTLLSGIPAVNKVDVRTNKFEPKRAHIIIYNWQNQENVTVNLSTTGLQTGDSWSIHSAQDRFGNAVKSGTWNTATPTVSIPMTNLTVEVPYRVSSTRAKANTAPRYFVGILTVP